MAEWPRTVYTTMQPDVPVQVEEAEWTDLSRQGLLADDGTQNEKTAAELKAGRQGKEG